MEEWKKIDEYHYVSNLGRVKKVADNKPAKILKLYKTNDDCNHVNLAYYGSKQAIAVRVDLLVAKAFIPNPNNFKVRKHINGNKTDDRASNLEWVEYRDHRDSNTTALNELKEKSKEIVDLFKDGHSIESVGRKLNVHRQAIKKICENNIIRRENRC